MQSWSRVAILVFSFFIHRSVSVSSHNFHRPSLLLNETTWSLILWRMTVYLRRCDTLCSGHFIIIKTYFSREFKINALKMTYWRSDENLFVVCFNCLFRIPWALGLLCCILVILILISRCSFYCRRLTEVLFHIKRPETLYASIQTQMWMLGQCIASDLI